MKRLLAITATILIALSLCCCSNQENNPEEAKSDSNTESITSEAKTSDVFIPDWDAARNRTTWNIELSLVEINERNIIIEMVDYDNIGFLMNDLYYVLERWEEGEWVNISNLNPEAANEKLWLMCRPDPEGTVSRTSWSYNIHDIVPGVELFPGHYRITKVLSGKDFSLEFDIQ